MNNNINMLQQVVRWSSHSTLKPLENTRDTSHWLLIPSFRLEALALICNNRCATFPEAQRDDRPDLTFLLDFTIIRRVERQLWKL